MIALLGLLGGLLFAFAAVPSALATWRNGKSIGVPANMAWLIFGGVVALFSYLTARHGFDWVLALTYGVEGASWATILWFHYMPRQCRELSFFKGAKPRTMDLCNDYAPIVGGQIKSVTIDGHTFEAIAEPSRV